MGPLPAPAASVASGTFVAAVAYASAVIHAHYIIA